MGAGLTRPSSRLRLRKTPEGPRLKELEPPAPAAGSAKQDVAVGGLLPVCERDRQE